MKIIKGTSARTYKCSTGPALLRKIIYFQHDVSKQLYFDKKS